ncbi:DUF1513 domain-containing protein [Roseospirillum parvum]|uniref:Uncharacterized protein n=1 Tax=Roseospirillum parvum TaxID=83401 RepID=A0A1G7WDI7_9PROT|nr:DUF1513 domain-containing protein [Roseospirillum parvum]SDG70077.1 hypothetical protein SAMN05421742_102160 [Roseospirillum parvum]
MDHEPTTGIDRRTLLKGAAVSVSGVLTGCATLAPVPRRATVPGRRVAGPALLIPGYHPHLARFDGRPVVEHPHLARAIPQGHDGPLSLVSRLSLATGEVDAALFPIQGHVIATAPETGLAVFHTQGGRRSVAFDAQSLDMVALSAPFAADFVGGGHAIFLPGGKRLLTVERAPYDTFGNRAQFHYGRLTVREAETLKPLESFSSQGIGPHDVHLLPDGKTVAVAHYGSTRPRAGLDSLQARDLVEPSLCLIELASGRLLDKLPGRPDAELRHLAMAPDGTTACVQVRLGAADSPPARQAMPGLTRRDATIGDDLAYLPAGLLHRPAGAAQGREMLAQPPTAQRQGLSIVHDPVQRVFLTTYPSSHTLIESGEDGGIRRIIDTAGLGLPYPCGLTLGPGGTHWLIAGHQGDVLALTRPDLAPDPQASFAVPVFGHSHIGLAT